MLLQLIFEAIPKSEADQARRYRGYIAVDSVEFRSGDECKGHCTFDSGLCKFSNDPSGNFDWKVVSGVRPLKKMLSVDCRDVAATTPTLVLREITPASQPIELLEHSPSLMLAIPGNQETGQYLSIHIYI